MERTWSMPTTATAPGIGRAALAAWLGSRVPPSVLDDAVLLTSEVVTNAVRHGSDQGDVRLGVTVDAGTIRVRVAGPGPGPQPEDLTEEAPPGLAESGWGLLLVRRLSTDWGVDADGTVWFELMY